MVADLELIDELPAAVNTEQAAMRAALKYGSRGFEQIGLDQTLA